MSRTVTIPPTSILSPDGATLGGWWHEGDRDRIVCDLCPRECHLAPGDRGFCFVRENRDGQMWLTTYGRSTGFCIDPIEKKPLNHFYPGTSVLSFGTAGCNLGCKFCQNWSISKSREVRQLSELATPATIAQAAREWNCQSVAFTYNDPVVWAEYAIDTARECRALGIKTVAVTAGYITQSARSSFFEWMDAANVDLKAFTEEFYQRLTLSHLQPVLDTLCWLHSETDVWLEITNLVIPGANDETDEFRRMCDWIFDHLGPDVPVHFTAFHPDFRLRDRGPTPVETLLSARQMALDAGLHYAYVGNVHDVAHQSTYCPSCRQRVIERNWYELGSYAIRQGQCAHCGTALAGRWLDEPGRWGRKRQPVDLTSYAEPIPSATLSCVPTDSQRSAADTTPPSLPLVAVADLTETAGQSLSEKGKIPGTPAYLNTYRTGSQLPGKAFTMTSSMSQPPADGPTASRPLDPPRPQLSVEQQQAVLRAASELVCAAVDDSTQTVSDPTVAGAAEVPVLGCFVSIKRQQHLRGCCGFVGRRSALLPALQHSAVTSATGDVRMPKISRSELPHLHFQVWLLYGLQVVSAEGEERREWVEIGRHGLQIQRGTARGLLLPGVATEHGYDAEAFLQQVCLKAGLPPHAWKESDSQLATFEGMVIEGPMDASIVSSNVANAMRFSPTQMQQLADFCRDNVMALLRGAVPNYYMSNGPDGNVHGIHLEVRVPRRVPVAFIRLAPRTPMPLQATLFQMIESAVSPLRLENRGSLSRDAVEVDVTLFYEPALHGTVDKPDLAGLDTQHRAVVVQEQNRMACLFDPQQGSDQIVFEAARQAEVRSTATAHLTSYVAQSSAARMAFRLVPQAQTGSAVRPPAVAGTFYPADAAKLQALLDQLTPTAAVQRERWQAALVPHAGLIYSGRLAATVLQQIELPETIVILGPKHTQLGVDWAVAPHHTWTLPGIQVASDLKLATELCRRIDGLQLDSAAHQREHAIEVELPWIARWAPTAKVVGIALGQADRETCRRFARGLAETLADRRDSTLLVVSSDMNHFANDAETRRLDALALEALETMDADRLFKTVRENRISMCGLLPACMVLDVLRDWGANREFRRVGYATSAEVSGDPTRVVGYAGALFR